MRTTTTLTAVLMALAVLAACSETSNPMSNTGPSATAAPSPTSLGLSSNAGARFAAMSEADRAPLGSVGAQCASDKPVVTQTNQHGGVIDYVARYPYGTSRAEGELWQRQGTGRTETYRRIAGYNIGDGAAPFLSYTTEARPEDGRYKYRTRRTECGTPGDGRDGVIAVGEWSEFKDFTVGSYPEQAPPPLECAQGFEDIDGACFPIYD